MLALVLVVTLSELPKAQRPAVASVAAPAGQVRPAERSDEAAALVTARLCGGEIGIGSLTTEWDQAFATPGGTVRFEHGFRPVRVRRDGGWVPVDTTL